MTSTREFHIGDVISVATGTLVSLRHMDGVYDLCSFMSGESLMTHQLPRVSRECEPSLRQQHPALLAETIPAIQSRDEAEAWLRTLYPAYGETVLVEALEEQDHTTINPITELKLQHPDAQILVILADGDDR